MIIAVTSRRSSPGATTLAGLLATWWAEDNVSRLLVEADEAGGILAARWRSAHGLTWQPGLIELATMVEPGLEAVLTTSQPIVEGVSVVAAPPSPGQVINALNAMGESGVANLAGLSGLRTFVDCGRLTRRSAALPLARRAVVTLLVCRPELDEIYAMLAGVVELRDAGCHLGLVLVGKGQWEPEEIVERAEIPVLGVLPYDPKGAGLIRRDGVVRSRRFDRTPLGRAMDELTGSVQMYCSVRQRPVDANAPGVSPLSGGQPVGARRTAESGRYEMSPAMEAATRVSEVGQREPTESGPSSNGVGHE